ncbi:VWA domain-containing protein [Nocardia huaxiensis]|uniref:VWA domain-containing protein n=1 Tax=Nocardia huaxiensis TaxID=2755382 RepID=UPI001E455346|nr:VWA domain-containing protein [Nocardia huaxiensis]UFS99076.1 VWA domain-containing protein [Nocardia huaxiensis]
MSAVADTGISVAVDQNEYLAEGARTVDAIVTVEITEALTVAVPQQERVEILIIDCSGSMGTGDKFAGARRATLAALDVLPDGTRFAIVEGTDKAKVVFPLDGTTAAADAYSRAAARKTLDTLRPHGGTAIGTWLGLSRKIAKKHPGAMVHAILLTDGRNEHEKPERLAAEIRASEGVFTCDCRGVGTDWEPAELRAVASGLLGTADMVRTPDLLAEDFAAMMETSMAKAIPDLTLRVWTPQSDRVTFVKQVAPSIEDLTGRRSELSAQIGEYPLGSWGAEDRDYHVQIQVQPAPAGSEKLAARISVVAGTEIIGQGLVKAVWTTDTDLSARISRRVAHYTGQAELAQAVQEGLAARKKGDIPTATAKLQRAMQLAAESGNDATAKLLSAVVEVDEHGTVRIRTHVDPADERALDMRSGTTARVRKEDAAAVTAKVRADAVDATARVRKEAGA